MRFVSIYALYFSFSFFSCIIFENSEERKLIELLTSA
ncbi:MAG: hypothetical protein RLZZ335_881, partial [Bacteroidota bacterium]